MSEERLGQMFLEIATDHQPIAGIVTEIKTVAFGSRWLTAIRVQPDKGKTREFLVSDERFHCSPDIIALRGERITIP